MKKGITTFLFLLVTLANWASPTTVSEFIKIDQFGYRPGDQKIAVISDPQTGYNAAQSFSPGSTYEVRDWNSDAVIFSGTITAWNGGATHAQSGDKVFWFDFSSVTTDGSYYVYDPQNSVGSYRFEINDCVYNDVLKTAMRMYYYQRCGFAKELPYADVGFTDQASHLGAEQDTDCRLYNNTVPGTSKDLRGGWFDAGDYNKYVNFTWTTLSNLLLAYEQNPGAWADDYNIPESGNGIPDILDEVKYELDWLLRMQNSDGSVLSVIGGGSASPPSADNAPRRYGPATTSATLTAASSFALAAVQYNSIGQTAFGTTLLNAAEDAWTWANANPNVQFYNSGSVAAGEQEVDANGVLVRKIASAIYLYKLTGNTTYRDFVENNYQSVHLIAWSFAYPFEGTEQDMLLYYTQIPGITLSVKNNILNTYSASMSTDNSDNLPSFQDQTDAYRAFLKDDNYTWGSNQTKGTQATMFANMNQYNLDAANETDYENAASGFVHYFHGVNPNSKTFLSNMSAFGAENSTRSFYHSWYADQSPLWDEVGISTYGPAPGYVPGGVNPTYDWDGCCPSGCGSASNNAACTAESIDPPKNQPIQKSWKDFNTSWPLNSWTITEAGIYSQAAYVRMLSQFVSAGSSCSLGLPTNAAGFVQSVFPQPTEGKLSVQFTGKQENVSFRLLDVNGRLVFEQQSGSAGSLVELQLEEKSGLYFLEISNGHQVEIHKITLL